MNLTRLRSLAALAASGYSVARIGDASMSPLGLDTPHVRDTTPMANPLLEVWLIRHAAFVVHCLSGPTDIARAFALGVRLYAVDCKAEAEKVVSKMAG